MTIITEENLTPGRIVAELDKFIVGQDNAKRAVAIAIRNRWRRQQLSADIRDEVAPKNILMAGPTGVGKTEIARRLAGLVGAPFVKIEATKFTEVGYVGRDVESIVRDLVERSIQMEHDRQRKICADKAEIATEQRLLDYLLPRPTATSEFTTAADHTESAEDRYERTREKLRGQLRTGALEERQIEIETEEKALPVNILSNVGMEQMDPEMQNFLDRMMPSRTARRKVTVGQARNIVHQQEVEKLIDQAKMTENAINQAEQSGIVFLDEIDKVCGGESFGPDVSREGVQRDLLPLVEGSTIQTRHGLVHTDHILFIASGAFHRNKPADLMPELQGRFPIRVRLKDLTQEQFERILTEPKSALTVQQVALMATEGVKLKFTEDGISAMAEKAYKLNQSQQNIGARRLYAVMEKILEQISFDAPDHCDKKYLIDSDYVERQLGDSSDEEDLNVFGFAAKTAANREGP